MIGGICLLLALYAFQVLPINYAGLALILLGIAFMVAEAFVPSFGALGIGGVVAFVVGSIMLMDTDVEGYTVAWPLIAALAVVSAAFFFTVVAMAMKARNDRWSAARKKCSARPAWRWRPSGVKAGCACTARNGRRARTADQARTEGEGRRSKG